MSSSLLIAVDFDGTCVEHEFPEYESQLVGPQGRENTDMYALLEMIRYEDDDQVVLYVPQRQNLVLKRTPNPLGEMLVRVARRPSIDEEPRGQFDDVVWVQLARARFSLLALEAAEKSVQAPLALPNDVQELAFGPDAVLRSQNPQQIRRVGLELPNAAFTEQAVLQQEMRLGARYPEGRTGNIDASIITGQGVQALLGAFDSQIKAGQQVLAQTFEDVISLCLRADEKIFPFDKNVRGLNDGAPYELNSASIETLLKSKSAISDIGTLIVPLNETVPCTSISLTGLIPS